MMIVNKFIVCDMNDGEMYINVNYITCFRYDSETDMTEIYVHGFDKRIALHGDVTEDIFKMIYS